MDLAKHMLFADPPRNELRVLGSTVNNQYTIMQLSHGWLAGALDIRTVLRNRYLLTPH